MMENFIYRWGYIHFMAKFISVADDIYRELTKKKKDESYLTIIRNLFKKESNTHEVLLLFEKRGVSKKKVKELNSSWKIGSKKYA